MKPAGSDTASPPQEVLAGLVERVTYHNGDNGFCVLRIKARGHRDLVTVVGHAATIAAGEWITASGEWINDRTHGQQFKTRFMRTSAPTSIDGIEKYLGSGMIRGIGPVYARKMVKAFGEKVFDIIEAEPDRLREVTGIGKVRAKRITDAWAEQKIVREIMVFLHSHTVGTARAVRIYKTYGADAVQVMTENPYRLARDIRGIGFKTADTIAMKLGIEKTAMIRVRAGISYALTEAMDEGHCGLPVEELAPLAVELLEVDKGLVQTAMDLELADGTVIADTVGETSCIFLAGLYRAEKVIAERLLRLANGTLPWPSIDPEKALPWIEQKTGLKLAETQVAAIRLALLSKTMVITGGPGVGKTTIVNSILRILAAKGTNLLLCAPTGRAAKRMTEATGFEARTIHRLLEVDPKGGGFKRGTDNPLECDLLVVDETSMVDVMLMQALLKATPDNSALLIVGDIDQLPSVGPGQVLADVIASGAVPVVRLTEVFRQAAQSRIVTGAHRINQGLIPDLSKPEGVSDFYFVQADDPETAVPRIVELVKTRIPQRFGLDPIRDIQVLCPMNRGGVGARSLNVELQAALNPAGERNHGRQADFDYSVDYRHQSIRKVTKMPIAGRDQAIGNIVKWSARDDWTLYREQVFAEHLDSVANNFDVTVEELVENLGDAFGMLYGVILEDFFTARFGDDGELNVIDDYLKRRGWREKVPAKQYLTAIRDSVISLYEVVDLDPGKAMTVRDMIRGGDPVTVEEKLGSESAARWDRIAARLVTVNNKPCFTGGMLLLSHEASGKFMAVFEETAKALRTKLRREAKKQSESPEIAPEAVKTLLLESSGARLFTQAWLIDGFGQANAPLPEMRNTDGDKIMFSEVRFPITGDEAKLVAVIDGIENIERNAPVEASWTWHGRGSPSQRMAAKKREGLTFQSVDDSGRTSLGSIEVKNGALLLSTNSRERAEKGRDLLASHLGSLVGPPLISHEDIDRALERSKGSQSSDKDDIPPEIAAQIIHNYLDDHYRRTLDDPMPFLDGKSPRQAAKTKKGRAKVIEWLKRLENSEHRRATTDSQAPYDLTWMWKELNLSHEQ